MTIKRLQVGITAECKLDRHCKYCNKNILKQRGIEVNYQLKKESINRVFQINDIDYIQLCGNAGEALYHPDFDEIVKVARQESNLGVEFNTNAAYRCKEWWQDLGKLLNRENDIVMFAIDGLKEVHEIHRAWSFDTVIENMLSFIKGGGNAGWQFIIFRHNQHQLEICKNLAREFGVKRFVIRNSRKYDDELRNPTIMNFNTGRSVLFAEKIEKNIKCWSKDPINLLFIDAGGRFWPCPAIPGVYMLQPCFDEFNEHPQKLSEKIIELIEKEKDGIININVEQDLEKIQRESELWNYILSHTETESICNCYCNENRNLFGDETKNFHRIIELN